MDFTLSNEQRAWQMTARKFAEEEIRPISLERDDIDDPRENFDWEIIKKGSKLGFRTLAVPKEWGGHGTDFVSQALVMAELAKGDSAISKTFSQCWKWSHLIAATCSEEQKRRFLKPFLEDDTFLLGKGISEPSAGSDNRLPAEDPKAGALGSHRVLRRVAAKGSRIAERPHGDSTAASGEQAGGRQSISPVVSGAADNGNSLAGGKGQEQRSERDCLRDQPPPSRHEPDRTAVAANLPAPFG